MSSANGPFGLSHAEAAELKLSISFTDKSAEIVSAAGSVFEIVNGLPEIDLRDTNLYHFAMCVTGFVGESQVTRIQTSGTHVTLGYIFPVTSFRSEAGIEGNWPQRFARVAFHKLIDLGVIREFAPNAALDGLRGRRLFPDELFPDHLSALVVGKANLERAGCSLDQLRLMLLARGATIVSTYSHDRQYDVEDDFNPSMSLKALSGVVEDEAAILFKLLSDADADTSSVGRFLRMYQLIEFAIEKVYVWGMEALVGLKVPAWKLKKRLASVSSDRSRLGLLAVHCLDSRISRTTLDLLASRCTSMLANLEEEVDGNTWNSLLYSIRNIVVHDQMKMIRQSNDDLSLVNDALRPVCFEIAAYLTKPNLEHIWQAEQGVQSSQYSPTLASDLLQHSDGVKPATAAISDSSGASSVP